MTKSTYAAYKNELNVCQNQKKRMTSAYYFELGKNPVRFDPVSMVTNVFFDEVNQQIFAVKSVVAGTTNVVVKGPTDKIALTFDMKDRGPLISVKFSYHHRVLALQRSERCVDFSNFVDGILDPIEYSQTCKGKTNKILTFHWISDSEVVFVTALGIEFYQVNTEKRFLKLIKSHTLSINWSVFSSDSVVLMAFSSKNLMVPFSFKNCQITKLQKFEVDTPKVSNTCLIERDVSLLSLYNALYAAVLRQPAPNTNEKCLLDLYILSRDQPVRKSFILRLGLVGRFQFSVVDNLIVAHHQVSKTSMMFDVRLPGLSRSNVVFLDPLINPLPIKPFIIKVEEFNTVKLKTETLDRECDLYANSWIVFHPNIVIDAALGCMWYLKLILTDISDMFFDQCHLLDFLLLRKSSKPTILEVCKQALSPIHRAPVTHVASIFSKLNQVYKDYIDAEQFYEQKLESQPDVRHVPHHRNNVVLDQNDVFTQILEPFAANKNIDYQFKFAVLTEYLKSLDSLKIKVKHFIYELLITVMVNGGGTFQLQQFLHHKVIRDSKLVACHLLSLESTHPACFEMALDMLKRLATSDEQVIEVMLSKQMILPALRFIRHVGMYDLVPARKFLNASTHDDMLFYTVYKFFEARNIRLNGKPEFTEKERCNEFMDHYIRLFATDVVKSA
ncbi:regulator of MON1-CCZ1 complex-like isoform X1 [Clavelina lepadiformis]|uniref:regulator of MON1-CCZ1 complex-like isoform X1 n=1 Tax=Clavelina lepadiformis TaxID=159417 RepID=UPI00404339F8